MVVTQHFRLCIVFLPTPSARRVTNSAGCKRLRTAISTHTLCEEGDMWMMGKNTANDISTHTLCEEGDSFVGQPVTGVIRFLPTPSARRVTSTLHALLTYTKISTHTLCEEGDQKPHSGSKAKLNFYPHPLRGG